MVEGYNAARGAVNARGPLDAVAREAHFEAPAGPAPGLWMAAKAGTPNPPLNCKRNGDAVMDPDTYKRRRAGHEGPATPAQPRTQR
jgi:hypothetical protein